MAPDRRAQRIRRSAARAERRLRYRLGIRRLALWLPLPLGVCGAALSAVKVFELGPRLQNSLFLGVLALTGWTIGMVVHGVLKRPPRWAGTLALDRHHHLNDRLTTALEYLESEEGHRSSFAQAAIEEGLGVSTRLEVRRAVPVPVPRELLISAALAGLLLGITWFEIPVERPVPSPLPFQPLLLAQDDLSLYREIAQELGSRTQDAESQAALRRFNRLLEDLVDQRVDRREAFERLGRLEAELSRLSDAGREARELGLEGVAQELARSGLTKQASEALEQKKLKDAEQALRKLSERLRKKDERPSPAELDRLRSALARASRVNSERLSAIEARRRELEQERQSLLKKHKGSKDPKATERDPKLSENRRQLERLQRDKARAARAAEELSELDRELARAAEQLAKDLGESADAIDQGAEDLNRIARRALSDREKRELLQRLRELREILRQEGQAGAERKRQMMRFSQRARGKRGQGSETEQSAEPGRSESGPTGRKTLVELPRVTQTRSGAGSPDPETNPGSEKTSGGSQPGRGHDPNLSGEASSRIGQTRDVSAAGVDTGQGTASAEVIYGAAEQGFTGRGYREVYVQYQTVAEQALEQEPIPPGYRFYVRRYFQLIRPRE